MVKGILFDLDGVIVDTAKYHYEAWNRLAETMGFTISEEQNHQLKGVSRMESLDLILKMGKVERSVEERAEMARQKNDWYVEMTAHLDHSEILPGVEALLHDLRLCGVAIGLGSASKNSVPLLTTLGLLDFFDVIIDGTKTTRSKPDPQVFDMGAAALQLAPTDCLVIEDSIKGLMAAIAGGFQTLGIGDDAGLDIADHVVTDLSGFTYDVIHRMYS